MEEEKEANWLELTVEERRQAIQILVQMLLRALAIEEEKEVEDEGRK